jgi:hypothetical protein
MPSCNRVCGGAGTETRVPVVVESGVGVEDDSAGGADVITGCTGTVADTRTKSGPGIVAGVHVELDAEDMVWSGGVDRPDEASVGDDAEIRARS